MQTMQAILKIYLFLFIFLVWLVFMWILCLFMTIAWWSCGHTLTSLEYCSFSMTWNDFLGILCILTFSWPWLCGHALTLAQRNQYISSYLCTVYPMLYSRTFIYFMNVLKKGKKLTIDYCCLHYLIVSCTLFFDPWFSPVLWYLWERRSLLTWVSWRLHDCTMLLVGIVYLC